MSKNINEENIEQATFGAGCFWCVEAVFDNLDGVVNIRVGYTGGKVQKPSYEQVCSGTTGHVEVIQIAIPVLRFIGLLQIVDAVCFTLWFALTGAGDTKIPALVDVLTHWILFIPACYILGIVLEYGYWGMWFSFGIHLTYFAGFVFWRFRKGHWKEIKI